MDSIILSIRELENMIKAIKENNPHYGKRVKKYACGKFQKKAGGLVEHAHIGCFEYETITY